MWILYVTFIACSALTALLGMQFRRGRWLEHITLIQIELYDREALSRISSAMCFVIALAFSLFAAGAVLGAVSLLAIVLTLTILISIGYWLIFTRAKKDALR